MVFKPGNPYGFKPGNPGRPHNARNKLTLRVFEDVLKHWQDPSEHDPKMPRGINALERMYKHKPVEYVRAVLSILPKELQVESITQGMSPQELETIIVKIREYLATTPPEKDEESDQVVVH